MVSPESHRIRRLTIQPYWDREGWIRKEERQTFQILGSQNDGSKMMILDETLDLRSNFGAIPAHKQHLPYRPDT